MTPVIVAAFAAAFIALACFSYSYTHCDSENKQRNQEGNVTLSRVLSISFQAVVKSSAVTSLPYSLRKSVRNRFLKIINGRFQNHEKNTYRAVIAEVGIGTDFCDPFPFFAFATSSLDAGLCCTSSVGRGILRFTLEKKGIFTAVFIIVGTARNRQSVTNVTPRLGFALIYARIYTQSCIYFIMPRKTKAGKKARMTTRAPAAGDAVVPPHPPLMLKVPAQPRPIPPIRPILAIQEEEEESTSSSEIGPVYTSEEEDTLAQWQMDVMS